MDTKCNSVYVQAKDCYQSFVERVRKEYGSEKVKDGVFGSMMNVSLVNDVSYLPCLLKLVFK